MYRAASSANAVTVRGLSRTGGYEASKVREQSVQRRWHPVEIERVDEEAPVSDLAAAARPQEASELLFVGPSSPRRLPLEGAERVELILGVEDAFHGANAERADQLVLEILDAHEEPEPLHVCPSEVGAQSRPLETESEAVFLVGVIETRHYAVSSTRSEPVQNGLYAARTPHWHDRYAFRREITAAPLGKRLDCSLITDSLDEHDGRDRATLLDGWSWEVGGPFVPLIGCHLAHRDSDLAPHRLGS
jgi:hypothetical protein